MFLAARLCARRETFLQSRQISWKGVLVFEEEMSCADWCRCVVLQTCGCWNVCCQGMACVGRSKVCTLVAANHFGPIPGVQVGSQWKFRVQVGHTSSFCICNTAMRTVTSCLSVTQLWWNFRVQVRHIDSLQRVFLSPIQRVSWPLSRHVSFMRMCDCHVFHILPHFCIFQQSAHITYFFLNKLAFLMAIFTARCYASAVLAMGLCLCLSVCHKSEFY